jgi:diacylglycerol O-acyltransferase / wax synthase
MPTGWMSDVEALMWNVQRDPFLDPTFGSLSILDAMPDHDHVRARLLRMVDRNPRFGQHVVSPVGRLTPPAWCDDPEFDIDHHFRVVTMPSPGDRRQLYDLAARLVQEPLDRTRPLWEFVLVDGLAEGGAGLVQKLHHTITDGEGGLRVAAEILDLSPDLPDLGDVNRLGPRPRPPATPLDLLVGAAQLSARRAGAVGRAALGEAVDLATHPTQVPEAVGTTLETVRSVLDQFTVSDRPLSPLWTSRTLRRRLDGVDVPLEPVQAAARALGGSVNDAFVTALSAAIATLHQEAGRPAEALRSARPVSTRGRGVSGENAFVPARLVLPLGDVDPRTRFAAVHDVLDRAKHERVLDVVDQLAMVANLLPVSLVTRITREQSRAVDFAASNVRGASVPLWLGGARLLADYPIGPLTAAALNVTLLSYDGMCHLGVHSDAGAIADPGRLAELIGEAFDELVASSP